MIVSKTNLEGCLVLESNVIRDERGYFHESFNEKSFRKATGLNIQFVQDNQSKSSKGVLRGLHFQKGKQAQAKLVRVQQGSVLDVCVDIRKGSKTFMQYFSIVLDDIKHQQLFVPRGFAHGFLVLEDNTVFSYKCDNYYDKKAEAGIIYNDKTLKIDWQFLEPEIQLSEKDKSLPTVESILNEF